MSQQPSALHITAMLRMLRYIPQQVLIPADPRAPSDLTYFSGYLSLLAFLTSNAIPVIGVNGSAVRRVLGNLLALDGAIVI